MLRSGPYRLFFYASDSREPAHVHVQRERMRAKIWLAPIQPDWSEGFKPVELGRVIALVGIHQNELLRRWHEFFKSGQPTNRFRPDYPGD